MSFTEYSTKELGRKFRKDLPFGLEKLRVIREDRMVFCEKRVKQIDHSWSPETLRATLGGHEKEKDWAVSGGIASAIGGAGAGIASAINTQKENAEIRKRNAERNANAEKVVRLAQGMSSEFAGKYLSEMELMMSTEKKEGSLRIGISKSTEELASYLKIDLLRGNAIRILSSYKDSRIDGYLKMVVENEGEFILPMPYYGVDETKSANERYLNVTTICIETRKDGNYNSNKVISVEPLVLWTIEDEANEHNYTANTLTDIEKSPDYQRFMKEWSVLPTGMAMPNITAKQVGVFFVAFIALFTIIVLVGAIVVLIATNGEGSAGETFGKPVPISCIISLILAFFIAKSQ